MSEERAPERPPWVKWRNMAVCQGCWNERNPDRQAARLVSGPDEECIKCEQPTNSGIYVRMRVEWR